MLGLVIERTFAFPAPKGVDLAMNDDDPRPSGLSGEVPSFAARSMVSPRLHAALKASIGDVFRPLMADVLPGGQQDDSSWRPGNAGRTAA
jgi:hypothetical protein